VSESLVEGARGSAVIWLRTALEDISGESLDSNEPDLFDAALAEAVSRYQHDQGMTASGAADELTIARLQADIHLVGVSLGSRGP
jgi:murein L,D-transpeptidase YcbB/YkuD